VLRYASSLCYLSPAPESGLHHLKEKEGQHVYGNKASGKAGLKQQHPVRNSSIAKDKDTTLKVKGHGGECSVSSGLVLLRRETLFYKPLIFWISSSFSTSLIEYSLHVPTRSARNRTGHGREWVEGGYAHGELKSGRMMGRDRIVGQLCSS
jgi:hypothetical protein